VSLQNSGQYHPWRHVAMDIGQIDRSALRLFDCLISGIGTRGPFRQAPNITRVIP
jgi:hypothetical protein